MIAVDLFGPRPSRAAPRVMMRALDSGLFPDGKDAARFSCARCHHDTGWIYASRSEVRRGVTCSHCNGDRG